MTRDEIFERIREMLTKTFGSPAEKMTPTALLQKDLDLDSIDAVDSGRLPAGLDGREVPEEALRAVRTVDDVVSMVETHLAGGPTPGGPPPGAAIEDDKRRDAGASATRPNTPFALGDEPRDVRDLGTAAGDAACWRADWPGGPAAMMARSMVACADRYLCAVALLAVWQRGRIGGAAPEQPPRDD